MYFDISSFFCNFAQKNKAMLKQLHVLSLVLLILVPFISVGQVIVGAERTSEYLPLLENKNVGLVVNHTSYVKNKHLLDTLLEMGIKVKTIFAPEHGFRGTADAGEHVNSEIDSKTGVPIVSLYGKNRKPTLEQMKGLDVVVFDIQDVGIRFYTYISTMQYVMEVCAEAAIPFIVFDRPNPNGEYFDGPVLEMSLKSFVGMHPIPLVHGLTVGELAMMIKGEKWLGENSDIDLTVIECDNYDHTTFYSLPIPPSPNLPNDESVRLYPSLGLFEATDCSIGRGTTTPFQVVGYPDRKFYVDCKFTPTSSLGAKNPPQKDKLCYGQDFTRIPLTERFTLKYLLDFCKLAGGANVLINNMRWLNMLAGTEELGKQIIEGKTEEEIRKSWQSDLDKYSILRDKYIIY